MCGECKHLDHSPEWCSVDVMIGSGEQAMCGCPPRTKKDEEDW